MALIKKEIEVVAQIGDIVKPQNTVFRDDITLYICHIEGDLLYISNEKDAPKNECETSFAQDCYLVKQRTTTEEVITKPKSKRKKLPTTLLEAVDYFTPAFKGMEKEFYKRSEDDFSSFCHSQLSGGIGMQIRNRLKLWDEKSVMHNHMKHVQRVSHPEDMSDKIIREIYKNYKKA